MQGAVAAMDGGEDSTVVDVSALYETAPVGGPAGQGPFLNAAAMIETTLDPKSLLDVLHRIEKDHKRQRSVRWGPRTLDLDLLLYGDAVSDDAVLQLPHPRMLERPFVMAPLCDLAPDLLHPQTGMSIKHHFDMLPRDADALKRVDESWVAPRKARA